MNKKCQPLPSLHSAALPCFCEGRVVLKKLYYTFIISIIFVTIYRNLRAIRFNRFAIKDKKNLNPAIDTKDERRPLSCITCMQALQTLTIYLTEML